MSVAPEIARSEVYFAENLNTVVWWNFSPGFRIELGKSG